MNIKKILISDFDYTLYVHENAEQTKRNFLAIKRWRELGNLFVIATGRSAPALSYTLPDWRDHADFVILNDGAIVRDNHDCPILIRRIRANVISNIELHLSTYNFEDRYQVISYRGDKEESGIHLNAGKLRFWFKSIDDCKGFYNLLTNDLKHQVTCIPYYNAINFDVRIPWIDGEAHHVIEVLQKGTDKATGADAILNMLQYQTSNDVYSIGDDINDHTLLQHHNGYIVPHSSLVDTYPSSRIVHSVESLINTLISKTPA